MRRYNINFVTHLGPHTIYLFDGQIFYSVKFTKKSKLLSNIKQSVYRNMPPEYYGFDC